MPKIYKISFYLSSKLAKTGWNFSLFLYLYFILLTKLQILHSAMIEVKHALWELEKVSDMVQLDNFFQIYLGKKWLLNEEFKLLVSLNAEDKKDKWAKLSEIKTQLTSAYEEKQQYFMMGKINEQLEKDLVDIGLDTSVDHGSYSLLVEVRRDVEEIFKSLWFIIEYGTEMVTKFENFEAVNIPLTHPATEMHDTIYLNEKDPTGENLVLRTHTSSMQNFMIKKYGVPLKALVPGRTYRFENMDATHDVMFYQVEGMYIAKHVSIAHFKNIIDKMLEAVLKKKVETRMRPWYFPFVEPGFEIDARYEYINPKTGQKELSKWLEILPGGMIHPNVLKAAGIDPIERSWFAFGIGMSRLAAIKYGIKDIRYFTNGDLRFAKSFV